MSGRRLTQWILVPLTLLTGLLASSAWAGMPALDANDRAKLAKGKVLVQNQKPTGGEGVAARAIGVVNAPPSMVWPVVRDCQHFHEFMPRTKTSRLISQSGKTMICEVEISMPFPLSNLEASTRAVNEERADGTFRRSWTLVKGDYKRNDGSWTVFPWGEDGGKSLLVYELDVNPDMFIPDAILRKAQAGTLPDVFHAVRMRVRSL